MSEVQQHEFYFGQVLRWARKPALQSLLLGLGRGPNVSAYSQLPQRDASFWTVAERLLEAGASLHERMLIPTQLNTRLRSGRAVLRYCSLHELLSWRLRQLTERSASELHLKTQVTETGNMRARRDHFRNAGP